MRCRAQTTGVEEPIAGRTMRTSRRPVSTKPPDDDNVASLTYGDGTPDGKKSLAGSGELIQFSATAATVKVSGVRIHGSRYGQAQLPRESFLIYFLNEELTRVLHTEMAPYSLFERGPEAWVEVSFERPVELPKTFWIALRFSSRADEGHLRQLRREHRWQILTCRTARHEDIQSDFRRRLDDRGNSREVTASSSNLSTDRVQHYEPPDRSTHILTTTLSRCGDQPAVLRGSGNRFQSVVDVRLEIAGHLIKVTFGLDLGGGQVLGARNGRSREEVKLDLGLGSRRSGREASTRAIGMKDEKSPSGWGRGRAGSERLRRGSHEFRSHKHL